MRDGLCKYRSFIDLEVNIIKIMVLEYDAIPEAPYK